MISLIAFPCWALFCCSHYVFFIVPLCALWGLLLLELKRKLFNYFSVCMDALEGFQWTKIKMVNNYLLLKKIFISVEPPVVTTSHKRPPLHSNQCTKNTKRFQVKSPYFEPPVSDFISKRQQPLLELKVWKFILFFPLP